MAGASIQLFASVLLDLSTHHTLPAGRGESLTPPLG
jgi:hypothetical protein